jgi:hypothetical protein
MKRRAGRRIDADVGKRPRLVAAVGHRGIHRRIGTDGTIAESQNVGADAKPALRKGRHRRAQARAQQEQEEKTNAVDAQVPSLEGAA